MKVSKLFFTLAIVFYTLFAQPFADETNTTFPTPGDTLFTDVDGDGDIDKLISKRDGTKLYLKNLGDGRYADVLIQPSSDAPAPAFYPANPDSQYFVDETEARLPDNSQLSSASAVGDVDGDGDLDILVGNGPFGPGWSGIDRLLINDGSGYFSDETIDRLPLNNLETRGVTMGDIDNDHDLDIILSVIPMADTSGQDRIYINNGSGFFTDETEDRISIDSMRSKSSILCDINSDGSLDLLISRGNNIENMVYLNDGSGYFTNATSELFPSGSDTLNTFAMLPVDVDGDFDLDLVVINYTPFIGTCQPNQLWINDGMGHFSVDFSYEFGELCEANSNGQSYDINNDDLLDIFLSGIEMKNLLINNGFGQFNDEGETRIPSDRPTVFLSIGDITGNGLIDIFCGNGIDEDQLYYNIGDGYFIDMSDGHLPSIPSSSTRSVNLADFDGDGDLDVFLATTGDLQNRLLINYSAVPDTFSPSIFHLPLSAVFVDTTHTVNIRARVTDNQGWIKTVSFFYRENESSEFDSLKMVWTGGHLYQANLGQFQEGSNVIYYFKSSDLTGNISFLPVQAPDTLFQTVVTLGLDDSPQDNSLLPDAIRVVSYPNPFNNELKIMYDMNLNSDMEIIIYNIKGNRINTLVKKKHTAGMHEVVWDGKNNRGHVVASGIYIIYISSLDGRRIKTYNTDKVLLLK